MGTTVTAVPYPYTAAAVRTNLCLNPSFESGTGTNGWTSGGTGAPTFTRVLLNGYDRPGFARLTATVSGTLVMSEAVARAGTAGTTFTVSAYVRGTAGRTVQARMFYNPGGTSVLGAPVVLTGDWQRVSITATLPVGTTSWAAGFVLSAVGVAIGDRLEIDAVLVEAGSVLGSYFDGQTRQVGTKQSWTGTPDASTSTREVRTPTAQAVALTPELVTAWSATRSRRTVVHAIIGRADPIVTTAGGGYLDTRTGTLEMWCATEDDAYALQRLCSSPRVMLTDPERPTADMYAVLTQVAYAPAQVGFTPWLVTADYVEVAPTGELW